MAGLFWRQFGILVWKNWIVLARHRWLNILRCFLMPVAYGIFLAVAQIFLNRPNNYGIGSPIPIYSFGSEFDGSIALVWTDSTNGTGYPLPDDIIGHMTQGFSQKQLRGVKKVATQDDIPLNCPANFNGFSECYAAISFNSMPTSPTDPKAINYTIHADSGLFYINVVKHTSAYEERLLPLQWALDSAITELSTGVQAPTPLEWPFTQESNKQQMLDIRLTYIRGLRSLLVLALFVCYVGIAYQMPGAFMLERASLITSHMKAMGLMDSARILSWHVSMSIAYLPAWVIVSIIWHFRIFSSTNGGLVFVIHLLLGLSLASWSFFLAVPFGKSPQLAAVASTFCAILFAILAQAWSGTTSGAGFIYTIIFPSGFYIFAVRCLAGWELHQLGANVLQPDPDTGLRLLPFIIAAIINIFLWPWLAVLLERRLYDAKNPSSSSSLACWRKKRVAESDHAIPPDVAVSIRNLGKDFQTSMFGRKKGLVTAISDLSIDIPKYGIYVLLGSNGAGKSTTMSILGNLLGRTRGSVKFEGGVDKPPRGTIGIVPQKNVLFPELTCYQTLRVWRALKRPSHITEEDDIEQLLKDCDLGHKIHYNADALSGGQKRKLQLAIGLIGGSKIVLVDECTSGVDPLSRRAIWRTLSAVRHERTIIFTTHFLDEADLLADNIAVLAAPGKLVAHGSPVHLKSALGEGYTVEATFSTQVSGLDNQRSALINKAELLGRIRTFAPGAYLSSSAPNHAAYHLKVKDASEVRDVLQMIEHEKTQYGIATYSVLGTSIEDIFLSLMHTDTESEEAEKEKVEKDEEPSSLPSLPPATPLLQLTSGRKRSPFSQAFTIFHKRALIARRSWLTPCLTIIVAVAGTCVPLFFLSHRETTCATKFQNEFPAPLYLPLSELVMAAENQTFGPVLASPPNVLATLGSTAAALTVDNISDNATFVQTVQQTFQNQTLGGISFDAQSNQMLFAWEATPPGMTGLVMLNLASNVIYNHALNTTNNVSPRLLMANFENLPGLSGEVLNALKWLAFYGAAMAVYPAFFSMYVSKERRSSVQAMQLSNGLADPVGLWLGHLMFDSVFAVISASIIIIIFAAVSNQFHGLGLFWLVLVFYGMTSALFSYCISLIVNSPLAAFAASAGYQVVIFVLYTADYLLILTYAKSTMADSEMSITHYTLSLSAPVASALRAAFVSVNLFSLLCDDEHVATPTELGQISKFGGPIVYLIVYGMILFGILVWVDSGSILPRRKTWLQRVARRGHHDESGTSTPSRNDVEKEALEVASSDDTLKVLDVVKSFGGNRVVDDVSFGVARDTIFALLGPNGAGKTTTFNVIRGDIIPDQGDVFINGVSVIHHPRSARLSLGVCPQFTAIDSQLTVREHLIIYGRLKGLYRGEELRSNVENLMHATSLHTYADRLASKLSGGNQRKLSLAIALIGNPSCVLIDEFSTGIDAKMKRDMWSTLRNVAVGKAIIITTHSMEEASALATKVGIIAKKMLVVGTTEELADRYATYEVHFSCRTREETLHAQDLMSRIPGSRMADDVATRFEVPIGEGLTLAGLFAELSSDTNISEYAVERATLESVFLKVIRENNVLEEDRHKRSKLRRCFRL